MNKLISITFIGVLILSACSKPAPPHRDFAKMSAKLKLGMTKPEVIAAIGAPDRDSETDPEPGEKSIPGTFVLFYDDGPINIFFVGFREGKLFKFRDMSLPAGTVPPP